MIHTKFILLGVACVLIFGICCYFFLYMPLQKSTLPESSACESLGQDQQSICFRDEVIKLMQENGVTAAITRLTDLTGKYPNFQNDCHAVMHSLGEEAYYMYTSDKKLEVSSGVAYCTYGFYHGFITEAVIEEGNFDIARDFCAYVNAELSKQGIEAEAECYHGFGHAAVDDHISTQFLTATDVTDNALRLCREVVETPMQYQNCASGVYNGVANIYLDVTYNWPEISEDNVLRLCEEQESAIQETCFGYFARVLLHKNNGDIAAAFKEASLINSERNRQGVVANTANYYTLNKEKKEVTDSEIVICRELSADLHAECIRGYAIGLVQSAAPTHEFESTQSFCLDTNLSNEEQAMCFEATLTHVRPLVPDALYAKACEATPDMYRKDLCSV